MDGIKTLYESNKKVCLCVLVALTVLIACFIMFCRQDNNGTAVSEIIRNSEQTREHIERASEQLDSVEHRIEQSQERIGNVQERIDESSVRVGNIIERNEGSQELVAESIRLSGEARAILKGLPSTDGTKGKGSN